MNESDDYLWDRSGPPDPDVAHLEALLRPLAHRDAPARRRARLPWIVGGVLAAAAVALVIWQWPAVRDDADAPLPAAYACRPQARGFAFTAHGGRVACAGSKVPAGVLPVGEVLETGAHEAELAIAEIGSARLSANTRIRLARTSAERHELYLEHGRMHAIVSAPPRIFAVTTPSVQVVDLGCEYTLETDARGAGAIEVQAGLVELERGGGAVIIVPAGTRARLFAARRAGLPLAMSATAALVAAVDAYDTGSGTIARVLAAATPADAITIANLVRVVAPAERRAVLERLLQLAPAPQQLTVDDVVELDVFDMWLDDIVLAHVLAQITRD